MLFRSLRSGAYSELARLKGTGQNGITPQDSYVTQRYINAAQQGPISAQEWDAIKAASKGKVSAVRPSIDTSTVDSSDTHGLFGRTTQQRDIRADMDKLRNQIGGGSSSSSGGLLNNSTPMLVNNDAQMATRGAGGPDGQIGRAHV